VEERYIVDNSGKETAVVLSVSDYERLVEDLHDLAVVAERRDEPSISLEEIKRKLTADGLLQS
jgi:PHD/YefM family antitoxin component YafN of YafNO toxin-antitoxin module